MGKATWQASLMDGSFGGGILGGCRRHHADRMRLFISAWFCTEHLSQQALMQLAGTTMLPIIADKKKLTHSHSQQPV